MAEISEIRVKNIKGFGDTVQLIKVRILPNKVNLLVAPNGWGKSSLTTAFGSLRSNKIDVEIPIPDISVQREIVNIHKCYIERQRIAEALKEQLKNICPVLIRGSLLEN